MKNPLYKRLPRDLRRDAGKFTALFLFMMTLTGFITGYIVANSSMLKSYNEDLDEQQVEDGHFVLAYDKVKQRIMKEPEARLDKAEEGATDFQKLVIEGYRDKLSVKVDEEIDKNADKLIADVESKGVSVQKMFYRDKKVTSGEQKGDSVRIYKIREGFNKVNLMSGIMPRTKRGIVIDRLYAENNGVRPGGEITVDGIRYVVTGLAAFSDYSALYKTNTQLMFDANHFTVAAVTDEAWDDMSESGMAYCYAWRNENRTLSDKARVELGEDIMKALAPSGLLTDIVATPGNQAITFAANDISQDVVMMNWLYYITMVVLALVFAISAKAAIENDSRVIGTLRASGYSKREILSYYISLPIIVTLAAAALGSVLGYTVLKYAIVMAYYHSYSLPPYETVWNGKAFVMTVVYPAIMITVINVAIALRALRFSPLRFLRGDLRRTGGGNSFRLTRGKFLTRFRLRVLLQNKGVYATMLLGVMFAAVLLLFGAMMRPLTGHVRDEIEKSAFAEYQYVLKAPYSVRNASAERYGYTVLESKTDYITEDIGVYGIKKGSAYFSETLPENGKVRERHGDDDGGTIRILVSSAYMEKYRLEPGDEIVLTEKYGSRKYRFTIADGFDYPSTLAIFMELDDFNDVFGNDDDYYSGYLSDEKLTEIDDLYIATTITKRDLTLVADQIEDSMGAIFEMFSAFASVLFVLIIYLLSKITIERNVYAISMCKILGYNDGEIRGIYNKTNGAVAILSLIISTVVSERMIHYIYYMMMRSYPGWLPYYIAPSCYVRILGLGLGCYFIVAKLINRRIRGIPLPTALKNNE